MNEGLIGILVFVGIWLLISFIVSRAGWQAFAKRYPARIRPAGSSYSSQASGFGGFGRYNNVVRVVFADAGLYFYVMFLFRAFHSPFLVPWESVKCIQKKDGFFGSYYWMEIADAAGSIRLRLPRKIERDLSRYEKLTQHGANAK